MPGEHDVFTDDGKRYLERYGKGTQGTGWHSFDHKGVHFIGLVNVMNLKAGDLGVLGATSSTGSRRTWPAWATARRSWCLPMSRCGPSIRSGAGAPKTAASPGPAQALRLGHRAERPHPSDPAKGRRERDLPHGPLDRLSPTGPGKADSPGPIKNVAGRQAAQHARRDQGGLCREGSSLAIVDSTLR